MSDTPNIPQLGSLPAMPRRIILHWTGGTHKASDLDRRHYHYIVEEDGTVVRGVPVRQNMRRLQGLHISEYAAHTARLNSFSVGVALAGMHEAQEGGPWGDHPLTSRQVQAACRWVARLCAEWGLPVAENTVFTHWEAEALHGVSQAGKWDIAVLPFRPELEPDEVGPWLRSTITAHLARAPDISGPDVVLPGVGSPGVQTPKRPASLTERTVRLTPHDLRRALRAEGLSDDDISRVARVLERAHQAAETGLRWWERAQPHVRELVALWAAVRGA